MENPKEEAKDKCCEDVTGFYLGTTCPKCNKPFRSIVKKPKQETLEEVELAILFHNTYEKLAPSFGYETREDTKSFDITTPNGKLMIAVCKEIIKWQQERSEEDMKQAYSSGANLDYKILISTKEGNEILEKWFEKFKTNKK